MRTVQLAIADSRYETALREALVHSGPWHVERVAKPDPGACCVLVIDEEYLNRDPIPLDHPERVVVITHGDHPETLSHAWDAGIVSVVSASDPPSTVLLAIMAAALRVPKAEPAASLSGISPTKADSAAPLSPQSRVPSGKRSKTH
ncbi:MAG: hypothetical protein U0Q18_04885 [Bryobacteraceae bacterium]